MAVSGHKSSNSHNIYQHIDDKDKLKMGMPLCRMVNTNDDPETIRQELDAKFQD